MAIQQYFPRLAPNSPFAYVALGLIAMAGVYYVNIIPALVGTLMDGVGFTEKQAGYVSSANIYGAALGAFLAVLTVKSFPWKRVVTIALVGLVSLDLLSTWVLTFEVLMPIRFLSGTFGGLVTGSIIGVMARLSHPTRAYGVMLSCHVGIGGLGLYFLPSFVPLFGAQGLFFSLMVLGWIALILVQVVSDYPINKETHVIKTHPRMQSNMRTPAILALVSIFIYQASNMELYAYLQRLGLFSGLSIDWISFSLATGAWVAIGGSLLAASLGTRFGRLKPIMASSLMSLVAVYLFLYAADQQVYLYANLMFQVPWAFLLTYLFGMCAEFDQSGQLAALGGMMSKLGMATGPFLAATLLNGEGYDILIYVGMVGMALTLLCSLYPAIRLDSRCSKKKYSNGTTSKSCRLN